MALFSACTRHGIVFILLPEYLWHVAWTFWSFARSSFLDLSYFSSFFFQYRTSKVSFTTMACVCSYNVVQPLHILPIIQVIVKFLKVIQFLHKLAA
jgi:hypothetical protein